MMELTEAKLKQMILEAFRTRYNLDSGIPTPDEKLRSDLGDETYEKIQSLDKDQADIMKQSLDPNYPRESNRTGFDEFLEEYGFEGFKAPPSWKTLHSQYNSRSWHKGMMYTPGSSEIRITYNITLNNFFRYEIKLKNRPIQGSKVESTIASGNIKYPDMFKLDLLTKEKLKDADNMVLSRERENLKAVLEKLK